MLVASTVIGTKIKDLGKKADSTASKLIKNLADKGAKQVDEIVDTVTEKIENTVNEVLEDVDEKVEEVTEEIETALTSEEVKTDELPVGESQTQPESVNEDETVVVINETSPEKPKATLVKVETPINPVKQPEQPVSEDDESARTI